MTGRLASTRYGAQGPVIVFLHGLFGQGRNWTAIAKALSDRARTVLPDLPDHGRSPWSDAVSYPGMAEAVAGTIIDVAADEPVTLVGHSMGGKVAMMVALLHPERVERLVVVDVSPVSYPGLRNFADYVRGMRALDLVRLADRNEAEARLSEHVPDPLIRSFLLSNLRRGADPHRPGPDGARWHWQMNLDLLGDHLGDLGSWPDVDVEPYRGSVLWLAGSESRYVQPDYASAMRTLFPRTQLVTVKGAGHWLHADHPDLVISAIRRFAQLG